MDVASNRGEGSGGVSRRRLLGYLISLPVIATVATTSLLTACSGDEGDDHHDQDGKVIIRISMYNSSSFPAWRAFVEEQCPDIAIHWEDNRNACSNVVYEAEHDDMPDIVAIRRFESDSARDLEPYLADLGDLDIVGTYRPDYLAPFKDGDVQYWLPAPGTLEGLWANETLFQQYDIELPTDLAGLIDISQKFAETGIIPLAVNCTLGYSCVALIEGFGAPSFLGTDDGIAWRKSFDEGAADAVDEEGFSQIATVLRSLKDAGVLTEQNLLTGASNTMNSVETGGAAMVEKSSDESGLGDGSFTFVALPFFGQTADDGWLFTYPVFSLAMSAQAADDKERDAACKEVIAAMLCADAQAILNKVGAGLISYNTDVDLELSSSMEPVRELIDQGRCYIRALNSHTFAAATDAVKAIIADDADAATFISVLDEELFDKDEPVQVGYSHIEAENDLDQSLCSPAASVIAQSVRAQSGVDITVIDSREATAPIYKGAYSDDDVAAVTMSDPVYIDDLSGARIRQLMDDCIRCTTTFDDGAIEPLIDYPALAGMTVTMEKDGTVDEISLANGTSIEDDATYAVAVSGRIYDALEIVDEDLIAGFELQDEGMIGYLSEMLASSTGLPEPGEYYVVR